MKHVIVWYSPIVEGLPLETQTLMKVQIDNSLDLGYKPDDIIFVTNFPYEYRGVKSLVVDNSAYCDFRPGSTKTTTINRLIKEGVIVPGEIYWAHDPDCYEINKITDEELDMDNFDIGFTTYGWSPKPCLGSYFFKHSAGDLFQLIRDKIYEIQNEDERALVALLEANTNNIKNRITFLNITYQIGMRHVDINFNLATKPLKALHFHPSKKGLMDKFRPLLPESFI